MGFKRAFAAPALVDPTGAMVGIGMELAAAPMRDANIEDTLLSASIAAMRDDDLRVLAILATWFGVHAAWVNADRLIGLASTAEPRVRALWAALGAWQGRDRRFARLSRLHRGPRLDVLATGTDFQIKRHGEDARFADGPLRVPANLLRDRRTDVLDPPALARRHRGYRHRIMMGPSYRADMWAALEADPSLSAAALARVTHGSFATAWHVHRDFALLHAGRSVPA